MMAMFVFSGIDSLENLYHVDYCLSVILSRHVIRFIVVLQAVVTCRCDQSDAGLKLSTWRSEKKLRFHDYGLFVFFEFLY